MKQLKLKKLLIITLTCASFLSLNPITAHADWIKDSTGWWNSEGYSWSIGWKKIDGNWYYFDSNGYMKTGWLFDADKWYYLNKNGSMMNTGWFEYNNDWYYLYSDGSMAINATIDGYKFNSDGKWDKVYPQNNSNDINEKLNITGSKEDEKTATNYLRDCGYEIISSKGAIDKYVLNKDMLYGGIASALYSNIWGEQNINPDDYLGKEITTYTFLVKNHPLEKTYHTNTFVSVMMYDGKVIGGYSNPDADLVGGNYSLDGKTLEEVTGMTYLEWSDKYLHWDSYPHFYKKDNFIVEYTGEKDTIISSLNDIFGEQFAGLKHSKELSSSADIRKIVYEQLDSDAKKSLKGSWHDFDIRTLLLSEGMGDINDKSYIGKNVYLIDYTTNSSSEPNDKGVYMTMDTLKILGHGYSD